MYAERLRETEQLNVILTTNGEFGRLSAQAETAIFAVIQEAVNNAKKYARAARIDLILESDPAQDTLTVLIKDDGVGFDVQAVMAKYDERGSLGMINMQERVQVVNGVFKIRSEMGKGTEVILTLPLTQNLLQTSKDE
jgi:signal transduction histidine kinase